MEHQFSKYHVGVGDSEKKKLEALHKCCKQISEFVKQEWYGDMVVKFEAGKITVWYETKKVKP